MVDLLGQNLSDCHSKLAETTNKIILMKQTAGNHPVVAGVDPGKVQEDIIDDHTNLVNQFDSKKSSFFLNLSDRNWN